MTAPILIPKYKPLVDAPENVRYFIITGGRGCFCGKQLIQTDVGVKPISEIKKGDKVLSYNEATKKTEYKRVANTFKYDNDKIVRIRLKNGIEIKVTEDHKFYYKNRWVSVKDLLSLFYGTMEKDREI